MPRLMGALAALTLFGCVHTYDYPKLIERPASTPARIVFHDVRVFDSVAGTALEHQDVVVEGEKIASVTPTAAAPAGATVIEGAGKTLLPGYVDIHTHVELSASAPWAIALPNADHAGRALLRSGITSALDMGGDPGKLADLAKRQAKGEWLGPRLWYPGKIITPKGGYPASFVRMAIGWPLGDVAADDTSTEIGSAAEGVKEVDDRVNAGAHHLKVAVAQVPLGTPVFDLAELKPIVDEAKAKGLWTAAHVDTAEHMLLAAHAGVMVMVHGVHLGELTVDQAKELASLGVKVAPTLDVWDRIEQVREYRYQPTETERHLFPEGILHEFDPVVVHKQSLDPKLIEWMNALQASHAKRIAAVMTLHDAGVELLVGADDNGSAACWAGGAFLDELRLLHEAGLSNAEVLSAATLHGARLVMPEPDFGEVAVGKRADLVLVEGNPLDDITATSRIAEVMQGGVRMKLE
ncbi:MAG: amidohydrolase family protein [Myxococcaceae bacterium]